MHLVSLGRIEEGEVEQEAVVAVQHLHGQAAAHASVHARGKPRKPLWKAHNAAAVLSALHAVDAPCLVIPQVSSALLVAQTAAM